MSTLFRTVCATLSGAEAGAAARILQGLQYKCSFSGVSVQRTQIIGECIVLARETRECSWTTIWLLSEKRELLLINYGSAATGLLEHYLVH